MPKNIPFESACILGCGVMTGYGSAVNAAKVKAGSSVVVLGAGGVGLNVIQGARISGAAQIIAVDVIPSRLEFAKKFGATETVLADRDDVGLRQTALAVRHRFNSGQGADYAFECTAIPALGAAPLAFVRNAGTAIQCSGIEEAITFDMELFEWDKIYMNPLYGKCRPTIDFPRLFSLYDSGDLLLDEQITKTYPLQDLDKAFADMHAGRKAKGVVVFS
jgi:S-(hydroxymethyl)glutathione dehydrogenase/alcohol dehydrogenase